MTIPPYARLAAKLLKREQALLPPAAAVADAVRSDAVAAIERALVQRASRKRTRRALFTLSTVAAAFGMLWFSAAAMTSLRGADHGADAVRESRSIVAHTFGAGARVAGASERGELQLGARVQALPEGHALLVFGTGTRVSLDGGGDLTLVQNDAAQVLALEGGALRADVAKLAPGRRFLIHTPDAEVEVHGTSFRVITNTDGARCGGDSLTRVEVFEGVVTVRHRGSEVRIGKGQAWPASCAVVPSVAQQAQPSTEIATPALVDVARSGEETAEVTRAATTVVASALTAQNDAFAAAVSARRAGDYARSVRGFDALIARYPRGPLLESAEVQRIYALREIDRERARVLARVYLERYPSGFAREQVAAIAVDDP